MYKICKIFYIFRIFIIVYNKKLFFVVVGVEATAPLVQWFWEVMDEFSNQERSLFLRFVWGRTRLPRTIADFRGRDFVLQVRKFIFLFPRMKY